MSTGTVAPICAYADSRACECHISDGVGFPQMIAGPGWSDPNGWKKPEYYSTIHVTGPACAVTELCNGRDDDCDDMIDEDCDPGPPDTTTDAGETTDDPTGAPQSTTSGPEATSEPGSSEGPPTSGVAVTDPGDGSATSSTGPGEDTAEPGGCDCGTHKGPGTLLLLGLLALPRRRRRSCG